MQACTRPGRGGAARSRWFPASSSICSRSCCSTRTRTWRGRRSLRAGVRRVRGARGCALICHAARPELADEAADALARLGNAIVPELAERLRDETETSRFAGSCRRVLVRIGTAEAEHVLIDSLLHADTTLRHRVVASLNKLRAVHPDVRIDPSTIELLLAAEIAGHYRSYQVLGPLQRQMKEDDPVLQAMRHSMEQELERIFRLMNLLYTQEGLHDAYVGLRAIEPDRSARTRWSSWTTC